MSAQTLVNLYAELNESKDGPKGAFYGTPGLVTATSFPAGEGRALATSGDRSVLYAVVGANVYKIDSGWGTTYLGQLATSTGRVSAVSNATQTAFMHSGGWGYTTLIGNTLGVVSGAPGGAIGTYMDGYVMFTENLGGEFGITAINDLTSISALDIATAEALPDNLLAPYADQREVWLLSQEQTEIWADTGAESFPFERIPGGVLSVGCAAANSPAYVDGSVFWLAADRTGKAVVIRNVGYQTLRVSTHAIEYAIDGYATVADAWGYGYVQDGHPFYVLTFPTADVTWAYDCSNQIWHRRGWRDSNGVLHRHRANAYAFFNDSHCVLDQGNGTLYTMSLEAYTDAGDVIYRERAWPLAPPQEMHRLRCDELELVAETGVGAVTGVDMLPQVWLQMSFDGGVSFGNERYQNLGAYGLRQARARWRRNGMGRRPVARLGTTSTQKVAWIGVNVVGEAMQQ